MAGGGKQIMIVAGEASADRYGGRLVARLRSRAGGERLEFWGTGGDSMASQGVDLLCHVRQLAHIGPREAIVHIGEYYRTFGRLLAQAASLRPALALLLDFPDFNLRLAKRLKRLGITVIYYISPQLWAWRRGRIRTVRKYVDKMLVILPFEEEYYRRRGVSAEFVGHPILEGFEPSFDRERFAARTGMDPALRTIALLPGSRRKEIDYILPGFLEAAAIIRKRTGAQCVVSVAPTVDPEHVRQVVRRVTRGAADGNGFFVSGAESRDILANSDFGLVKSGTSTLEAALVGTPYLIAYKLSNLSWVLGNKLVRTPYKGLVNLIAGEGVVPEFIQWEAKPETLAETALGYLASEEKMAAMRGRLAGIRAKLSSRCASEAAAEAVSRYL